MFVLDEALGLLRQEEELLGKLLYRNHNQHGKAKLFTYLRRVRRSLPNLQRDATSDLCRAGEAVLRLKTSSASSSDVSQRIDCLGNQFKVIRTCLDGGEYCAKALEVLKDHLGKQLFVPLFTTLVALTSRILQCLASILCAVRAQHEALVVQLKNVSLLSSKHKPTIETALADAQLGTRDALLLEAFSTPAPLGSLAAPPFAALSTSSSSSSTSAALSSSIDDDEGEEVSSSLQSQAQQPSAKKRKQNLRP